MVGIVNRPLRILQGVVTVTGLLLCGPLAASSNSVDIAMSFAEAWHQVAAESDALAAARANVEEAEYKKDAARDLYLPEIGISASYLYLDDTVTLSPEDLLESMPAGDLVSLTLAGLAPNFGLSAGQINSGLTSTIAERENLTSSLRAQWPIYAGGRIDAAQDIAGGRVKEAGHALEMKTEEQFENLIRYYFGAVLTRKVLETRIEVEAGLKKHRDHAILLEEQGQIAKVERMQSEASYDKVRVERRKTDRDLEIAQLALTRMLKSSGTVVPTDSLFIDESLPPLSGFIDKTLARYPGLLLLDSKKEQVEGLINIETGKYLPSVAVFGNYSLYEEDDLATKLVPDWVVGVGMHIPILERTGRSGNLKAAKTMVRRIDALQLQARSDLSVLVEKVYRQAEQAYEEYRGLGSSLQLAEETVRLRSKAFSQGLSTSLDVVDAELFRAGIKTQRAVAGYNFVLALAKLHILSDKPESFMQYQYTQVTEVQ